MGLDGISALVSVMTEGGVARSGDDTERGRLGAGGGGV